MKIVRMRASNVKRLVAVEITPEGNIVEIRGKNAAGKSSVLDAIAMALGGKRLCPDKPVREGRQKAEVSVELGSGLIVTRKWTPVSSYLTVKDGENEVSSPQAVLDKLAGALTFDPLAFSRMTADKQKETLLRLVDLEDVLTKFARQRAEAYDRRRAVNRESDALESALIGIGEIPDDLPDELIDVDALRTRIDSATHHNEGRQQWIEDTESLLAQVHRDRDEIESMKAQINDHEQAIVSLRGQIGTTQETMRQTQEEVENRREQTPERLDVSELVEKLAEAGRINAAFDKRDQRIKLEAKLSTNREESNYLTTALEQIEQEKAEAIASASYPVAGLGFDGEGVTYNGIPFDQCSAAERLTVSLSMAMALSPDLRVLLIRDGSLCDADTLRTIYEAVKDKDYQLWIERVGTDAGPEDAAQVVIEDGRVIAEGGE